VNWNCNHKCAFGLASGVIIALGATGAALDLEMPQLHSLLIFFLVNIYIYIYIYIHIQAFFLFGYWVSYGCGAMLWLLGVDWWEGVIAVVGLNQLAVFSY
jgi:hypothetical protein